MVAEKDILQFTFLPVKIAHFPNPIPNFAQIAFCKSQFSIRKFRQNFVQILRDYSCTEIANCILQISSFEPLRKSQFVNSIQNLRKSYMTNCKLHFCKSPHSNLCANRNSQIQFRISRESSVTVRVNCISQITIRKCHSEFYSLGPRPSPLRARV